MLNLMLQRNASKFAIFLEKINVVFLFFISCYFIFPPNECPGLCRHREKNNVAKNEKQKKLHGFSFSINIANFEAFRWTKKLISNLFFLKSEQGNLLKYNLKQFLYVLSVQLRTFLCALSFYEGAYILHTQKVRYVVFCSNLSID